MNENYSSVFYCGFLWTYKGKKRLVVRLDLAIRRMWTFMFFPVKSNCSCRNVSWPALMVVNEGLHALPAISVDTAHGQVLFSAFRKTFARLVPTGADVFAINNTKKVQLINSQLLKHVWIAPQHLVQNFYVTLDSLWFLEIFWRVGCLSWTFSTTN